MNCPYRAKAFHMQLHTEDATYVVLSTDDRAALTDLGAFDFRRQLPDHQRSVPGVYGGAGGVSREFGSNESGTRDWVEMSRGRGVPINDGNGWCYVSFAHRNGRLISCSWT